MHGIVEMCWDHAGRKDTSSVLEAASVRMLL